MQNCEPWSPFARWTTQICPLSDCADAAPQLPQSSRSTSCIGASRLCSIAGEKRRHCLTVTNKLKDFQRQIRLTFSYDLPAWIALEAAGRKGASAQGLAMRIHDQTQCAALVAKCQSPTACILIFAGLAEGHNLSASHPVSCFFEGQTKRFGQHMCVDNETVLVFLNVAQVMFSSNHSQRQQSRNASRRPG